MKVTIKALRVNANLSQEEAAKGLGINKCTLIKWENHVTYPSIIQLHDICRLYKCTLDDIFLPDSLTKSQQKGGN